MSNETKTGLKMKYIKDHSTAPLLTLISLHDL